MPGMPQHQPLQLSKRWLGLVFLYVTLILASVHAKPATRLSIDEDENPPLRIAFLILVHDKETLEGSIRLLDALYHEDHTFFFHFDTKMPKADYEYDWNIMSFQRNNMRRLSKHSLQWGSWNMLAPWFTVAKIITNLESRKWDLFINLSGDSYPILKPEALRAQLDLNGRDFNYMTCSAGITGMRPTAWSEFDEKWHKRKAFPFPIVEGKKFEQTQAYFGSQWMVLTREFVNFVMEQIEIKGTLTKTLADWFEFGTLEVDTGRKKMMVKPHIPDEIFFPTILMNTPQFNGSFIPYGKTEPLYPSRIPDYRLPTMRDMIYVRMDEHYPWSSFNQRYESPHKDTRVWGPYYLGTYDLANIKRSGALFMRKLSSKVDENLLRLLPVDRHEDIPDIGWPNQLLPLGHEGACTTDESDDGSAPAPAPAPLLPGINILKKSEESPVVDARGCVAVAESIHCPPAHHVPAHIALEYDLPVGVGYGG